MLDRDKVMDSRSNGKFVHRGIKGNRDPLKNEAKQQAAKDILDDFLPLYIQREALVLKATECVVKIESIDTTIL